MKYWFLILVLFFGASCATSPDLEEQKEPERAPITMAPVFISFQNRTRIPLSLFVLEKKKPTTLHALPARTITKITLWGTWLKKDKSEFKERFLEVALPEELGPAPLLMWRRVTILREKGYGITLIAEEDPWVPFGVRVFERGIRNGVEVSKRRVM